MKGIREESAKAQAMELLAKVGLAHKPTSSRSGSQEDSSRAGRHRASLGDGAEVMLFDEADVCPSTRN